MGFSREGELAVMRRKGSISLWVVVKETNDRCPANRTSRTVSCRSGTTTLTALRAQGLP